ncbi:DUF4043 family protein [Microbulbifer sp. 2205BS26-8]|uniref:phage capsid family protein n=1 Tax=Microbulbifer sp. 2205BS26-8 TaxID=3064386 RepID=UPI0027400146|nr:DUF4043 family protein [Microbulbifer sp. 2205BS26-8]MDP5211218.1 DUF4043 family protein [Microbulbifer sp. 2205BS26-8]
MPQTMIADANRVKQWDDKAHTEYVRSNRFKRYMGANENAIIQVKEDLTKKRGDAISIPLVGALDASSGPNDGSSNLVGHEKALPNDGHSVKVRVVRDATVVNVEEEQASAINIRNAGRVALKDLQMRYLRNDIIRALGSVDGRNYADATPAQRNAWHDNNKDRVLYGSAKSNFVDNDHAASLANIDNSDDKLTHGVVSLAKRIAQNAQTVNGDGIRPYRYGEDMETFVMFVPSFAFRDLREDLIANQYWQDALARSKSNPLFSGPTSIEWDGVLVREIPEIPTLPGAGAGTPAIEVSPCYLCGAQALAAVWAMRTKTTTRKEDDYGFFYGVGFQELREVSKLQYGQDSGSAVDWGLVSVFTAGVADQ